MYYDPDLKSICISPPYQLIYKRKTSYNLNVPGTRFELVTRGFSVLCSTSWAIPTISNVASHPHFIRWLESMSIKGTRGITKFSPSPVISINGIHSYRHSLLHLQCVFYITCDKIRESHLHPNTFVKESER